ncbi:MAG: nucleotidyl transferase AbiEii/AbiGii toxin family protein [Xanthobacteraceae bacterium]|nr:nucleotidyl transferase AbiEii/AbiGii toxin family protein [Xanthobacteraceae bacterium]
MPNWRLLLDRTVGGLARLKAKGQPVPPWMLGGGTALMLHTRHRLSKDIDAFIDDPQYLTILSPRLGGEGIWECTAFEEQANHLKLVYPEGEIDFIVAGNITGLADEPISVESDRDLPPLTVNVEHPVEIALKKLHYRGTLLKIRDIFDIAVVDSQQADVLDRNLVHVSHLKRGIAARLTNISDDFCRRELAELDIADGWRSVADTCLSRVRQIVRDMPEAKSEP